MPPLVVTDLDRTFWPLSGVAPTAHLEALGELRRAGHVVIAATGRRRRNLVRMFDSNGLQMPAVVLDGSMGIDFATARCFHRVAFHSDAMWGVLDVFGFSGIRPCLYIDDHGEPGGDVVLPEDPTTPRTHLEFLEQDVNPDVGPGDVEHDVLSLVVTGVPIELAETAAATVNQERLGIARVDPVDPDYGGSRLTVTPPGVSKATGVEAYCRWAALPVDFTAIGDGVNDLELLQAASVSIAVADGYPDLVAAADHIIAPPQQLGWSALPRLLDRGPAVAGHEQGKG